MRLVTTTRRVWVAIIALATVLVLGASLATAGERYPERPVELIVPAAAGGGTDIVARILAEAAEPILGQKLVVVNKPGGSGTIGLGAIAQARPDGYSLGCIYNSPLTMVPNVLKVGFAADDFTYVTMLAKGPMLFAVRSEFPAKTAAEFFEYAKKNPGKLTYAGDGVGNIVHFSGERVFHAKEVKLRLVPFGGAGESIKALLGGHVDIYGGTAPPAIPHIKAGKVRALFVTTREKVDALPDVPGVTELGSNVPETFIWRGIIGPKGLPADRAAVIEKALQQAVQSPRVSEKLKELGEVPAIGGGKEFERQAKGETAAMAAVAKQLGLSPK
jgi:tripartite-type tricarboxylate transporter receptor subunit TctC